VATHGNAREKRCEHLPIFHKLRALAFDTETNDIFFITPLSSTSCWLASKMESAGICTHLRFRGFHRRFIDGHVMPTCHGNWWCPSVFIELMMSICVHRNKCNMDCFAQDGYLSISPNPWSPTDLSKDTQADFEHGAASFFVLPWAVRGTGDHHPGRTDW